jgi:hypothetical protein
MARPQRRTIQPTPPPRVSPPTPTCRVSPAVMPSPCGASAAATWPQVAPPPPRINRRDGSMMVTSSRCARLMIMPWSSVLRRAMLCPPERTVTGRTDRPA